MGRRWDMVALASAAHRERRWCGTSLLAPGYMACKWRFCRGQRSVRRVAAPRTPCMCTAHTHTRLRCRAGRVAQPSPSAAGKCATRGGKGDGRHVGSGGRSDTISRASIGGIPIEIS
eukprot:scaffold5295_cov390-Prasinococcus_capsulatus_cf.AAC.5